MTTTHPPLHRPEVAQQPGPARVTPVARAMAILRIALGFVFLWAFLDKTFGWHYSTATTPKSKAWIHGGSPTRGFLSHVEVGPLQSWYRSIAGHTWADWLFMLGLLGIGVALLLGVAVRLASAAGVLMLAFMWFAEFPPAQHDRTGALTGSSNPLTDYHFIYALALLVIGLAV
ncbi:MAG TPA: DoxX family membrane protein, partial [Jatrophihabitans sp.]|nr:DoxX family membrane protein [Jatrophihabitans sp.]